MHPGEAKAIGRGVDAIERHPVIGEHRTQMLTGEDRDPVPSRIAAALRGDFIEPFVTTATASHGDHQPCGARKSTTRSISARTSNRSIRSQESCKHTRSQSVLVCREPTRTSM